MEIQTKACIDHRQALDMWRDVLFDYGVLGMVFRMQIEDARAFSLIDSNLAAVGLSNEDAGFARIFSFFHEVCHICLHQPGVSGDPTKRSAGRTRHERIERFCDRFAAGFLLPANDTSVRKMLAGIAGDPSSLECAEAARTFKVSGLVILRRALDLGYIEEEQYWTRVAEWKSSRQKKRKKSGGDYVKTRVSYMGKRMVGLVFQDLDSNRISLYDASKLLALDPSHFQSVRTSAMRGALHA
jgi:Zn-dependent peptidase ImmA (M78 family)